MIVLLKRWSNKKKEQYYQKAYSNVEVVVDNGFPLIKIIRHVSICAIWNTCRLKFLGASQKTVLFLSTPSVNQPLYNRDLNYRSFNDIHMIIGCTLSVIWSAHFRLVFDNLVFVPNPIAALATLHI
ncbi:hypothetical protein PHYBLDRAFT_65589 [Phycomyces blakesleeanus NRRL 1555(-)]|uniref:Uncharacterized protein n=1 Tax=Phycomyces blakesleeanus (strain ATCC 8743b / DSM 1359 / FGSC 10004 / NBRC 33097 / NRRL 1555) TaxID=763407 RepID=A0A162X3M7_PHYB8|nr:hypothetical protein PHYBLDRAFT_65589 [Phycomyces blakesleeanus NRRL 1555(-)]OAD72365.1 hypothetical protein PHYBLDRAFT_65589 [Phycomyces blakesleeanus NRRL 1555(-)]|eukprot:XP_018290405.1 hypothetical protein PHYBLDRAFT_65589 [Phycomyces blakesleeanus NRRL 1555(-)]